MTGSDKRSELQRAAGVRVAVKKKSRKEGCLSELLETRLGKLTICVRDFFNREFQGLDARKVSDISQ